MLVWMLRAGLFPFLRNGSPSNPWLGWISRLWLPHAGAHQQLPWCGLLDGYLLCLVPKEDLYYFVVMP